MNYALRGDDSLLDQKLVESTCALLDLPCQVVNAEPRSRGNLQAWAREIRLEVMRRMRRMGESDYFFLGHHQGDQLETLFMKLARGASPSSFASLSVRSGRMIRPLLDLSKREIVEALEESAVPYRIDRSNLGNKYQRNEIRNTFFADLDRHLPKWRKAFSDSAFHWAEAARFLKRVARHSPWIVRLGKKSFFLKKNFYALPPDEAGFLLQTALRAYFPGKRFSRNLYDSIFEKVSRRKNGALFRSGKHAVVLDHGLVGPIKSPEPFNREIHLNETISMIHGLAVRWEPADEKVNAARTDAGASGTLNELRFSLPEKCECLRIRSRRPGDAFLPFGLSDSSGPVKLKDWFISHHVPRFLRDRAFVIEAGGEIAGILIDKPGLLFRLQTLHGKKPSSAVWVSRKFLAEKHGFACRLFIDQRPVVG